MPMDEERRRAPAVYKKIEEVDEGDIRISVIGTIVDKGESRVAVDDGTGTLEVGFDLSKDLGNYEEGDLVRVVGRPSEGSVDGEAIQDFQKFNKDLYEKALKKIEEVKE